MVYRFFWDLIVFGQIRISTHFKRAFTNIFKHKGINETKRKWAQLRRCLRQTPFLWKAWPFEAYGVRWMSHESGWILDETILLSQEPKIKRLSNGATCIKRTWSWSLMQHKSNLWWTFQQKRILTKNKFDSWPELARYLQDACLKDGSSKCDLWDLEQDFQVGFLSDEWQFTKLSPKKVKMIFCD